MPKFEWVFNKEKDEWEEREVGTGGPAAKPRRSMVRGAKDNNFDFKFTDTDGVTVLCKYVENVDELRAKRAETTKAATALKEKAQAFDVLQKDPKNDVPIEKMKELEKQLRSSAAKLKKDSEKFAGSLVRQCVIGWENGSTPYSVEVRDNLPDEIAVEWMSEILNRHDLTEEDSSFLSEASATTSLDEL